MSNPFLAEIRMVGFNFAPRGWSTCDGQILPINQNQSLYSLLGTTYGGDGRTTFGLPGLRGRAPLHAGTGNSLSQRQLGQKGGSDTVALGEAETPPHVHGVSGTTTPASTDNLTGNHLAMATGSGRFGTPIIYSEPATPALQSLAPGTVATTGGGGHPNVQPSLAVYFIIALQGVFPSRN